MASQSRWQQLAESEHPVAVIVRITLGVALGIGVVVAAEALIAPSVTSRVVSEIGMAIIVATVSVFAIELRAHDRLVKKMVAELVTTTENQRSKLAELTRREYEDMTQRSEAHFEKLAAMVQRSGREAMSAVLLEVFKNLDRRHYDSTIRLIDSIDKLDSAQSWTDRVSMRFVGELLRFVSQNADNLVKASQTGGAYDIELPSSSEELADRILAEQMREMVEGDSYVVVSDIWSWHNGLGDFYAETLNALERRVKVRRLICPFAEDGRLKAAEIEAVIERHWNDDMFEKSRDEQGKPMYELGILKRKVMLEQHNVSHVGVFYHQDEIACFEPQHQDLSRMAFSKIDKLDKRLLERLWKKAHTNFHIDARGAVQIVTRARVLEELGKDWWK